MKKLGVLIIMFSLLGISIIPGTRPVAASSMDADDIKIKALLPGKKVEVVTFAQLQKKAEGKNNDTLYVVNFWATWCKPCVLEMPFFEEASRKFSGEKVKVIYVSLNSVKEAASVERFTEKKNIQNTVLLLNAPNPNDWIDKIDPSWSGAIPATAMYKNGKKVFFKEGGFTQEEINSTITNTNQ